MGHWDSESGHVILPATAFASIRKAVEQVEMKRQTEVFEHTQTFWKELTGKQKANPEAYKTAVEAYIRKHDVHRRNMWGDIVETKEGLPDEVDALLRQSLHTGDRKPRRVLKTDVKFPTNRTTEFSLEEYNSTLTFNRETNDVRWYVEEGRGATEGSRNSKVGKVFLAELDKVKWTRGTGGAIYGTSELREHYAHEDGRGSEDACHDGYGPIGAATEPFATKPYAMADGTTVTRADFGKVAKQHAAAQKRAWDAAREKAKADGNNGSISVVNGKPQYTSNRGKTTAASNSTSFRARGYGGAEVSLHF